MSFLIFCYKYCEIKGEIALLPMIIEKTILTKAVLIKFNALLPIYYIQLVVKSVCRSFKSYPGTTKKLKIKYPR